MFSVLNNMCCLHSIEKDDFSYYFTQPFQPQPFIGSVQVLRFSSNHTVSEMPEIADPETLNLIISKNAEFENLN